MVVLLLASAAWGDAWDMVIGGLNILYGIGLILYGGEVVYDTNCRGGSIVGAIRGVGVGWM